MKTTTTTAPGNGGPEDYTTGEGLRVLLTRLHETGPHAWTHDPVAAELMRFAADKYRALAHKYGLDAWEAASAAFDVMRMASTRRADDPWAVITHAVRITCIAENRAQGLLCSTHQARRPHISMFHDAERLSEREEHPLPDYHPAFHVHDRHPGDDPEPADVEPARGTTTSVGVAVEYAITLLTKLEWPPAVARAAVEHVCGALEKAGSRQTAYENLRRDRHARALLDIPGRSWTALLKALLGNPHPSLAATTTGRGILLRLLIGESPAALLRDDDLVLTLSLASPARRRGRS